jgi:NAD(P)-dependent dehydrogenase (short-subunit alcohol dehydrogenase family)
MGHPDDVAGACLFLAGTGSGYITGSNLVVHGGGEWPAYLGALNDDGPG